MAADTNLDVDNIKSWRSILTLIVFVLTSERFQLVFLIQGGLEVIISVLITNFLRRPCCPLPF